MTAIKLYTTYWEGDGDTPLLVPEETNIILLEGTPPKRNYIDAREAFTEIASHYPNLRKRYRHAWFNCFMRWLILEKFFDGQMVHIDGDIVFHIPFDELKKDLRDKTFVLQGCPAFTSIADKKWFEVYREELDKLEADINGYSTIAAHGKKRRRATDKELDNVSLYENPFRHEQDFIEYLIASRKLPQEKVQSEFTLSENPLSFWYFHKEIGEIPFTHYQGTFCFWANIYLTAKRLFLHWLPFKYIIRGTKFIIPFEAKVMYKFCQWFGLYSRKEIIEKLDIQEMLYWLKNRGTIYVD